MTYLAFTDDAGWVLAEEADGKEYDFPVPAHYTRIKYIWSDGQEYIAATENKYLVPFNPPMVHIHGPIDKIGMWFTAKELSSGPDKHGEHEFQYVFVDGKKYNQFFDPVDIIGDYTKTKGKLVPTASISRVKKTSTAASPRRTDKTTAKSPKRTGLLSTAAAASPRKQGIKADKEATVEREIIPRMLAEDEIEEISTGSIDAVAVNTLLQNGKRRLLLDKIYKISPHWYHDVFNENAPNGQDSQCCLAFHGTKSIEAIIRNGFDCSRAKNCLFGKGLYFSDDVRVSMQYTTSTSYLLVNRVYVEDPHGESRRSACAFRNLHIICRSEKCCVPVYLVRLVDAPTQDLPRTRGGH
jgi:Poly(ADP-ribose) polymerase catalytic domain